ncbi:MAG: SdrD B-like domain-containing protein [Pontixanthobacter sp.]
MSERPIAWAETVPLAKTPELPPPELAPPPPSPANVTADTAPPAAPPVALPATDPSLPSPIALSDAADSGLDALSDDAAPEETRQRAIVALPADDAAMASQLPPPSPLPAAIVPERQSIPALAAAMPSPRVPIPLVSVDPPRVTAAPIPANDRDIDLADASAGAKARAVAKERTAGENIADATTAPNPPRTATLSDFAGRANAANTVIGQSKIARAEAPSKPSALAAIAPPPRSHTTLGLDRTVPDAAPASALTPPSPRAATRSVAKPTAGLAQDRSARFSLSAEAPTLDYQDELILEIQVKGVDASDTILAYGTRQGVYLPLGTLARILDLAIVVGEDGQYATGWFLDPDRTLTIDLNRKTLAVAGAERPLAPAAAVAFDGEMYLNADRMADFLPLTVDTDLRAQTVTLETSETFPFEARMKREADRARLANRAGGGPEKIFTRVDTPFLLASIPVGDVDVRAISDSTFGERAEVDLQFAGDLGFLTAETFLSADTRNGLTTSLIKLGRQDPDGELLGPLSATEFAFGDVATTSMPIGLRSVTGRGFAATNTPPEAVSVFERIDLRGILPDGFEVELYRNDILVGSTREAVGGRYEFLQVPVDFGLNVFRIVFFGPQGQRSEEVRRISVGDGRLTPGKLVYRFGVVEKDQNLLGVQPPFFIRPRDFGNFRASGELAYGVSSDITAVVSGAFFETEARNRWLATGGIRTGLGGFALKADIAAGDDGAFAVSGGIGGRIGASAVTLSHVEYSGDFVDETRGLGSTGSGGAGLIRSTEIDFNTTLELGNPIGGLVIPITARGRHTQSDRGLTTIDATVRASTRIAGLLASNTFDYTRTSFAGLESRSRLFGNFDLATLGRSRTRGRLSLGYQILPDPDIVSAAVEVDHAIDEDTAVRASLGYLFETQSPQIGLSAVRAFDKFSLALDSSYAFERNEHSIGLRLGFSFGRDPQRGGFFIARPGLANGGIASVRAFRDMDGDGLFGPTDTALPGVSIVAANRAVPTDADGLARLGNLSPGRGASLQVDGSTLPDIDLAPASEGIEIVPRPGRVHVADFPIVALSEVEGTLNFAQGNSQKGVSGVRLILRDAAGKDVHFSKTEIDGYYFFERVRPGTYTVALDAGQAKRLNLCPVRDYTVTVGYDADLVKADIAIGLCEESSMVMP